jgi:TetR/AcrR family transcriptional regulator
MPVKKTSSAGKAAPRNARLTKARILNVAFKEFAARGYDGARVDAIVARCKISKNLIYHYFSSKEDLFIQVMERAYGAMRKRQNELALAGDDPIADMRTLVEKTVQHFVQQPELIHLLATENLYKAAHIKKSSVIPALFNPLRTALARILEQGKAQGVFRQDANWIDL